MYLVHFRMGIILNLKYFYKTRCQQLIMYSGLEYIHHSSVSRRRRRKWNRVPGEITGPTWHLGHRDAGTWSSRLDVERKGDDLAL
jgi:hypothetical protein